MSIGENIKKLRMKYDLTQAEIGKIAGVSDKAVSTWENGTAEPRMGAIQKLADYFHIKKSELIDEQPSSQPRKFLRVPVLGSVPAGLPIEAVEDILDFEDLSLEDFDSDAEYFGLRVKGDSMFPKYVDGDTIIVKIQSDCESGQDAIVYVNGDEATLKRVFKQQFGIMLQPINPEYQPKFYDYGDAENPVTIAGIVTEIRRKV